MDYCNGLQSEFSKEQLLSMGAVEYAQSVLKLKLTAWQSTNLEGMQRNPLNAEQVFKREGNLYGPRALYLVYEKWKNRCADQEEN